MANFPRILIVAGSDSSGGAGIQADIKTVSMLGGYAMTAITAITAQNTLGVQAIEPLSIDIIQRQMSSVLDDVGVDAIKIGMLHHADVIDVVARQLLEIDVPIVLDPVMVATSGDSLLQEDAIYLLKEQLLPRATLITPNIPEAELLLERMIDSIDAMELAAQDLYQQYGANILLKGGHLPRADRVLDVLYDGSLSLFESAFIESQHTHGTGCTLSSAIATELGKGAVLTDAVVSARAYVYEAIATAPGYGAGHGPLNHLHPLSE